MMINKIKNTIKNNVLYIFILLYFIVNLLMLNNFPFMHSDESWLSGLTRTMINGGINKTETFFDLLPRYPHAIKSLFHIGQMPFILIFGYNLFAVRLVSLIVGCIALIVVYKIANYISKSNSLALLLTMILAFDVQFIYASHFARAEIIIAFGILLIYLYIIKNIQTWSYKKDIIVAIIIGIMIGFHPNAFIIALIAGSLYFYYMVVEKKIKFKNMVLLVGIVTSFALVYISISYLFDSQFISHYLKYGDHLGVTMSFADKISTIVPFYQKIWLGISGTYYTPWVKVQIVIFALSIIAGIVYSFRDKKTLLFLFPILAVNLGYIIIGRYSQPSILLMFIVCWILVFYLISKIKNFKILISIVMLILMIALSALQITPYLNSDYKDYLEQIEDIVPQNSKVLANLNTEYAFSYDSLLDYRNLGYLDDNGVSFAEYVKSNDLEYIIYPEEIDFIYDTRPVWNIVYGNIYPYYEDMNSFLNSDCELVDEFHSPYAMRIVRFANERDWLIKIYKVKR